MRIVNYILAGVVVALLGFFVVQRFAGDDFNLPRGGETRTETIFIDEDGNVAGLTSEEASQIEPAPGGSATPEEIAKVFQELKSREIMITDEVRHSIPLKELIGGGPPKDGIPPIDNPQFVGVDAANEWLADNDPGIAFSRGNVHRFYPYQILVWHEIVNDTVNGERALITYCPLCLTGFVFDPVVKGERVEFGTSGKLWKSNLVMYDRKTDSLWSQVLGEAIVGEMTGSKLAAIPSDQMLYGNWKKAFPTGQVLSKDTGAFRNYGSSPYGGYFSVTNLSLSLAKPTDTRLPNDAFVFGIVVNGEAKAYHVEAVKEQKVVTDTFENLSIILRFDKDLDVVRMFSVNKAGQEERLNPFSAFWFSWAAAHPNTELYK